MQDSVEAKQKLLVKINNQCAVVQSSIAKNYDNPDSKELLAEFLKLKSILEKI